MLDLKSLRIILDVYLFAYAYPVLTCTSSFQSDRSLHESLIDSPGLFDFFRILGIQQDEQMKVAIPYMSHHRLLIYVKRGRGETERFHARYAQLLKVRWLDPSLSLQCILPI